MTSPRLVSACVARVIPVIELHNFVMRGERLSAEELIANNAIHAGFVAGEGITADDVRGKPSLSIFVDGRVIEQCEGPALLQTIRSSLQWLTGIVRDRGHKLGAGQIILTGSIPSLIPIDKDCRLHVDAPPFGSVEVNITD